MHRRFIMVPRIAVLVILVLGGIFQPQSSVYAAPIITVKPITWNVIGLDSNDPAVGPRNFPVGANVCISGYSSFPVSITSSFEWDNNTNASVIQLRSGTLSSISLSFTGNGCQDVYFEVDVTQASSSFDKTRLYHITATDGSVTASTPQPRELYVEHLISQSRNGIRSVELDGSTILPGGTMYLQVGQTYDIALKGFTATQGYNQFEDFINLPNIVFRVNSVTTTYAADDSPYVPGPAPTTNPALYADACLWENDPGSPNYRSCIGGDYKAGGDPVSTVYNVTILPSSVTSGTLKTLLYDFSGSSYHYNADFGISYYFQIIDPTQVTINKSFNPRSYNPNTTSYSTLTITLSNPTGSSVTGLQFVDVFPTTPGNMTVYSTPNVSNTCGGDVYNSNAGTNPVAAGDPGVKLVGGTLAAYSSCTITVDVTVSAKGDYDNQTQNLFVNVNGVSTDTNKFGEDVLRVSSVTTPTVLCASPTTLATWNFDSLPVGGISSNTAMAGMLGATSTATNANAYYRANSSNSGTGLSSSAIVDLTTNIFANNNNNGYIHPASPLPSAANTWGIRGGWPIQGTVPNGTVTPAFEFQINAGDYSFVSLSGRANLQGSWSNPDKYYIYMSTDNGLTWPYNTNASWTSNGFSNNWGTFTFTPPASGVNSSKTTFRVYFTGASNGKADGSIFLDNINITGCPGTPAPNFSKSFNPDPIRQGETSTLTFNINNNAMGSQALTGISFTDTLPTGLTLSSGTASCGGTDNVTLTAPRTIAMTGGSLAAGASCTFNVTVTGSTAGHYNNMTSYLSTTQTGSTTQYAEDAIDVVAAPVISKVFGPSPIMTGGTSQLTFTITNPNTSTSLSNIIFTDNPVSGWPSGLVVDTPNGLSGTCGGGTITAVAGSTTVDLSGATLPGGSSCTFSVNVKATSAGTKTNTTGTVTAEAGGLALTGNTASATLSVNSPSSLIGLNKQVSTDNTNWYKYVGLIPGPTQNVWYRFTTSNDGETALDGISVTDSAYNMTACTPALPVSLAVGASASCVLGPIAVTAAPMPNPFINTATVTTATYTPATPVTSQAKYGTQSLSITKNATESYFTAASNVLHYSFTVSNNGGYPLAGPVTVSDDKIGLVSCQDPMVVGDLDSYLDPGESVACPATGTAEYTVLDSDVTAKEVTNTAHASAGGIDSADVVKTISLAALTIDKDTTTPSIDVSGNLVYTIVVVNTGQAALTNLQVSDVLPAFGGTSAVLSVTAPGYSVNGSYTGTALNTNLLMGTDTLAAGATATITVTVDLSNATAGTYDNTATVTTTQTGSTDDDGLTAGDAGTPGPAADPETDEDVVVFVQPDLTVTKTNNTANGWTTSGSTFQWTITARNGATAGTASFNNTEILSDTLPAGQSYGTVAVTNGATPPTGTINCSITGTTLSCVANGTVTMPANASFSMAFNVTTAGTANLSNTATVDPGNNIAESNEANNTGSNTVSVFDAQPSKLLVTTSEPSTNASRVTIGEMVRYRIAARLPQGTFTDLQLVDNIPSGLRFVNDGTARFAFVSNGGGITSSTLTCTNDAGNAFDLTSLPTSNVDCAFPGGISGGTGDGVAVTFSLGTVTNLDADVDAEYAVIEFNALILNVNTSTDINQGVNNQTGSINNNFRPNDSTLRVNNATVGSNSGNVTVIIAEPAITNVVKSVSAGPYLPGGAVTYTLTFSNVAPSNLNAAPAFDIVLSDTLDANLIPGAVNISSSQAGPCIGGTAFNTSTSTTGQNVTVDLSCLDPGKSATVTINATIKAATASGTNISNTGNVTYTSLPGSQGTCAVAPFTCTAVGASGAGTGERNGSGGPGPDTDTGAGAVLNNYADTGTANFTVEAGTITIEKQTLPDGSTQSFTFTPSYNGGTTFNLTDNGTSASGNLAPATYTVVESAVPGWTLTGLSCTGDADNGSTLTIGTGTAQIDLDPGENITCTFTSTKLPTLTLQKIVVNDSGGSALDTAWTLTAAQGATTISGVEGDAAITNAIVSTGTWTLSESGGPGDYTASTWSCPAASDANPGDGLTLADGEDVTCTITNDDNAPIHTITAVNDSATTPVNTPVTTSVTTNDTNVGGSIDPNSVSVTIQPPAGTGTVSCSSGSCQYTPPTDYVGTTTYTYQVCLAAPDSSICDTAVVTVTVTPVADVTTTVTVPATAIEGSTVDGTVTFANNGPSTAAGVAYSFTITPGLGTVSFTTPAGITASYDNITGNVSLAGMPASLTTSQSVIIELSYTAPATGPVTVNIAISTTTSQGANAAEDTASGSTAVTVVADVTTTVLVPASANAGSTVNGTVTFANNGPSTAAGVSYTFTMTPGLGTVSFPTLPSGVSASYDNAAGTITLTGMPTNLTNGQSLTIGLQYTAPNSGSVAVNTSISTTTSQGSNAAPDAANGTTSITPIADVTTTVTVPPAADAGSTVTGTITFANTGPSTAAGMGYTFTMTAGLGTVSFPLLPSGVTASYDNATGTVTLTGMPSNLSSGETLTIGLSYTAPASGPVTVDTTISTSTSQGTNTAPDSASASTTITPIADVTTTVNVPATANAGSTVTGTVTFKNIGPSTALGVGYTFTMSSGLGIVTFPTLPTGVTASYNNATGAVTLTGMPASLTNGETLTVDLSYTAPGTGSVTVASSISTTTDQGANTAADNASGSTAITPIADVATTVTVPASVNAGDTVTGTVTFANNGPSAAAGMDYTFSITAGLGTVSFPTLPAGITASYDNVTGVVTLTGMPANLASGQSLAIGLTYTAPGTGPVTVDTTISTTTSQGVNAASDTASGSTTISSIADVTTTVSVPAAANAGTTVSGTVTFANSGPSAAAGVGYTFTMSPGLGSVAFPTLPAGVTATYSNATGAVTLSGMPTTLNNGEVLTIAFSYTASATGPVTVDTSISTSTSQGANTAPDNASGSTSVTPIADVTTTVSVPASANAGNTVNGTVSFANNGPSTAAGVTYSFTMASGLGTVSFPTLPAGVTATYDNASGAVTLTGMPTSLTATQTLTIDLSYTAPASGPVTVATTISTTTSQGANAAPDDASGSTSVASAADVTTTVTVPASSTAGGTVNGTVTYANNGPSTASNTGYAFTITAGLGTVSFATPAGVTASYDNTTGTVTLTGMPAHLTSGQSVSIGLSYTAPATGPVTVASTISTTTSQGANAAPDNASGSTTVNATAIGIAKRVVSNTEVTPGVYEITYELNVRNFSAVALNNIQVTDDLRATFPAPIVFTVQSVTSADFTENASYSGSAPNTNLLSGSDTLAANASGTITLVIRVTPTASGPFSNTAIASGQCPTCVVPVTDQSQTGTNPDPDGDNDPTNNNTPTVVGYSPSLFDPPFGMKVFDDSGLPLLQWTMVWINNSNIVAINAQVNDPIAAGTTFAGGLTCAASGSSTTTLCTYDAASNSVIWRGTLGPDLGATDAASAANEVTITFNVNVASGVRTIQNVATVDSDLNGNTLLTDPGEQAVASASSRWSLSSTAGNLPATGFAPNVITELRSQPNELMYVDTDVTLEIPNLGMKLPVVGVPKKNGTWNVSWLRDQAGWLEGTAFPSWSGNSVLTGHVYLSNGLPGPFLNLGKLKYGDKIVVYAYGQKYTFEVRENKVVEPNDQSVLKHEEKSWLTLLTCKEYDPATNTYRKRLVVRAVLVSVSAQ